MRRASVITLSLAAVALAGALTFARFNPLKPAVDVITHRPTPPTESAWTFTAPPPAILPKNALVSIVFRFKGVALAEGSTPIIGGPALKAAEATEHFESGQLGLPDKPSPTSLAADIQLLDLSRIGAVSTKPGQDLRLLATLRINGGSTSLSPDHTFLPPGTFAGHVLPSNPQWSNNELPLLTFYVHSGQMLYHYDALLCVKPNRTQ